MDGARGRGGGTTILVPTFNEGGNVEELVRRLGEAFADRPGVEVLFVDDSSDDTPERIAAVAQRSDLPVRLLHRAGDERVGGLAGAVADGIGASSSEYVLVMDGDLQHPPELAPLLRDRAEGFDGGHAVDLVVASRYCGSGDSSGLSSSWRRFVSSGSTILARSCFPRRVGRVCTDPMTGFFCLRRAAIDLGRLRPRGFKILLEVLARHDLAVAEVPFVFGDRHAGESKASWRNGVHFLHQMLALRMGRMSRFAVVGGLGTVLNLLVMALLIRSGMHYLSAAALATQVAIAQNFFLQERFVFRDLRGGRHSTPVRALHSFAYNNIDTLVRLPLLALLVHVLSVPSILAQAMTLALAFVARFLFVTTVVYRPSRTEEVIDLGGGGPRGADQRGPDLERADHPGAGSHRSPG